MNTDTLKERPGKDTGEKVTVDCDRPQKKPALLSMQSGASGFQDYEELYACG